MTPYILVGSTEVSQNCAPYVIVVCVFHTLMFLENKGTKYNRQINIY
jgi:hypothetical protein